MDKVAEKAVIEGVRCVRPSSKEKLKIWCGRFPAKTGGVGTHLPIDRAQREGDQP